MEEEDLIQCDRCEKQISEDESEKCGCGRIVCWDHAHYDKEYDTGADIFECCDVCYRVEVDDPR